MFISSHLISSSEMRVSPKEGDFCLELPNYIPGSGFGKFGTALARPPVRQTSRSVIDNTRGRRRTWPSAVNHRPTIVSC